MPKSSLPEAAIAAVRHYCDSQVPAAERSKMRVDCTTSGHAITISESHPWPTDRGSEWIAVHVAELRYDTTDHRWELFCADSDSRWHRYELADPTARIEGLLDEIDRDPTGIFWG